MRSRGTGMNSPAVRNLTEVWLWIVILMFAWHPVAGAFKSMARSGARIIAHWEGLR